jgi:hypothetical protein
MDLRKGRVAAKPVERGSDDDRVHGGIRQRDVLGPPRKRGHLRKAPHERCTHLLDGLDRDEVRARRHEQARELARSRSEIEDGPSRLDPEHPAQVLDGLGRIAGPAALVDLRRLREPAGGRLVDHPASLRSA